MESNTEENTDSNTDADSNTDSDSDQELDVDQNTDADQESDAEEPKNSDTESDASSDSDEEEDNGTNEMSQEEAESDFDSDDSSSSDSDTMPVPDEDTSDTESINRTDDSDTEGTIGNEDVETETDSPTNPVDSSGISIQGRQLLVNGVPYFVKGVCWNPVPKGGSHPSDLDYAGFASTDIPLLQEAGFNTVRTYEPLLDTGVLDQLHEAGIYVMNTVYPWGGAPASDVIDRVNAVKNHPAVLMWVIGNEWNYNGLYTDPGMSHDAALERLNEVARLIRVEDADHPIATIYGELPDTGVIDAMPDVDVWGVNVYSGISFSDRFQTWQTRSTKPFFFAEYGADAYNSTTSSYDPESQAEATRALTQEIMDNASAYADTGTCLGGTIFEWADEWWKVQGGEPSVQDTGGVAPGGGPHPDQTFNEEWWGIVDIDRQPRPAYYELQTLFDTL